LSDVAAGAVCGRYPWSALGPDGLRGLVGLALTGLPLVSLPLAPWLQPLLGLMAALFLLFLLDTARRALTRITADDLGLLISGPWGRPRRLAWGRLARLRLRYFSTRRDRQQGWLTLQLGDGRHTLTLESTLEPFEPLLRRALAAATANSLALDEATLDNLAALGLSLPASPQTEAAPPPTP